MQEALHAGGPGFLDLPTFMQDVWRHWGVCRGSRLAKVRRCEGAKVRRCEGAKGFPSLSMNGLRFEPTEMFGLKMSLTDIDAKYEQL